LGTERLDGRVQEYPKPLDPTSFRLVRPNHRSAQKLWRMIAAVSGNIWAKAQSRECSVSDPHADGYPLREHRSRQIRSEADRVGELGKAMNAESEKVIAVTERLMFVLSIPQRTAAWNPWNASVNGFLGVAAIISSVAASGLLRALSIATSIG
jgi:hypothetical protein